MDSRELKSTISGLLKQDDRLWDEDKVNFNQTLLLDLVESTDEVVISLLLSDDVLREKFFTNIGDATVFKAREFRFFMEENKIDNSYTRYKNRIGLSDGDRFLKDSRDVVLNFPYKDCVLEGGQDKEDASRKEIFFNEVLAQDEIDRLFDKKALVNWKRYDASGAQPVGKIKRDENGIIRENMIIKGNNLLALHSLKAQFVGEVKLIYIDPPYNTEGDSFRYNDKFTHSTWLTFMKNRLEVAKQLLRDDGVIFVSCDDSEQAYLKILMDEIFGRSNFLSDVIWNSTQSVTNTSIISDAITHNLVFFKNRDYWTKNRTEFRIAESGDGFSNPDNDERGPWKADPFEVGGWRPNQQYEIKNPSTGEIYKPGRGGSWKNDYEKFQKLLADNRIIFGADGKSRPKRKRFLSEAIERGRVVKTLWDNIGTSTTATAHQKELFGEKVFNNPKPEELIERIIDLSTEKNDIVLDFFLGSGTTGAVAHKMGRQYIGIEQLDYIEELTVERLKKVLEGEQGGISKSVEWEGGGDFVYFELAEWNEQAKEQIDACTDSTACVELFDDLCGKYFLDYNVKIKDFREITKENEFHNLSLGEQKQLFHEMLDLNQMYVCQSEMSDSRFSISPEDQKLTSEFYNE